MTERIEYEEIPESIPCGWCDGLGVDNGGLYQPNTIQQSPCRVCNGTKVKGDWPTIEHKLEKDQKEGKDTT